MPAKFACLRCVLLVFFLSACSLLPATGLQAEPDSPPGVSPAGGAVTGGEVNTLLVAAVVLVAAGLLLMAVAALFLLRKRQRSREPVATSRLEPNAALPPLPDQTTLKGGAYVVLQTEARSASGNVYAGRGTTPLQVCPHCQAQVDGKGARFCAYCGADLRDMTLAYPRYVIRETADVQAFGASSQLLALRLRHPGLLLPADVFTETDGTAVRYYRVEPPYTPASDVPVPQEAAQVLAWGADLARALAYLHRHDVVLRTIDAEHIVIDNAHARLSCIDNALVIPQDKHMQAASYFEKNVQALGRLLLWMVSGSSGAPEEDPGDVTAVVPEDVAALLLRAQQPGMKSEVLAGALEQAARTLRVPEQVRFEIGYLTDVGQVRSLNEDSVLAIDFSGHFRASGVPVSVLAVADGMGGHAAGDVASRLAIEMVASQAEALGALAKGGGLPNAVDWLERTVGMANYAVYSERASANNDMGCTLVLALVIGSQATIANIGDSRAYRLSPEGIVQLTTDHSLVERLVEVGQITQAEARDHPQRNIIYRVVGDKPEPEYDLFEQVLLPGEALLLCSDGLSGMLTDEALWDLWRATSSPQAACARLVDAANQAGGSDNISVVIVQLEPVAAK